MSGTAEKKLSFADDAANAREQARKRELGDIEGRATLAQNADQADGIVKRARQGERDITKHSQGGSNSATGRAFDDEPSSGPSADADRIPELEREIAELKAQVEVKNNIFNQIVVAAMHNAPAFVNKINEINQNNQKEANQTGRGIVKQ